MKIMDDIQSMIRKIFVFSEHISCINYYKYYNDNKDRGCIIKIYIFKYKFDKKVYSLYKFEDTHKYLLTTNDYELFYIIMIIYQYQILIDKLNLCLVTLYNRRNNVNRCHSNM